MDNQKDFYIKSKFKQDDLISKNADDVFNNFLRGEIKMEEEKVVNIYETTTKDKKEKKSNKPNIRKILSIAATLIVIFLGANVYAATQGYNNIFFIINNLFNPTEVTDPNEILIDRDITISYQPIAISKGLSIQINRLVVKDNEAILYLDVDKGTSNEEIDTIAVYDVTNGEKELIANHPASNKKDGRYTEEIKLTKFSNKTQSIQLDFQDEDFNKIISLEINLDKKEINILSATEKEMEKISEVELKEFLAKVVRINFFGDNDAITQYHTEQEYKDEIKVLCALEFLNEEKASFEDVHKVIKEFTGETIESPLSLANIVVTKGDDVYKYTVGKDEHQVHALCLEITDIKYYDGIYTVNCVYTYPTDEAYRNNTIEELDRYTTTIDFTLNEEYEYTKYCILYANDFISNPYEVNNNVTDKDEVTYIPDQNIDSSDSENSENSGTIDVPENNNDDNQSYNPDSGSTSIAPIPDAPTATPINPPTTDETIDIGKVDNYASTMTWGNFYTIGLRGIMPVDWHTEDYLEMYTGIEDDGKLSTIVSGLAVGINKETNEIVKSNMTIKFYVPEQVDVLNTADYTEMVAERYNMNASGAGFTSNDGMDWNLVTEINDNRRIFCHLEPLNAGTEGLGYIVEIECDNYNNYKVINIMNWIFGNLKGASY